MITEIERKELRQLFQGYYADDILEILKEKKITNRNGKEHSIQYIRMVFQGVRKNPDIEAAIWQLASKRKQEIEQQRIQKQQILKRTI
ncbi:hypothetical protein AAON49_03105 [Pseudotenacibaculum sp. MALMAid0570]|uniref:hypothetical protein n=1 Tax=Pseudotenacibaculum sp. MALMAid0570 TaxID=3143938 RepID=UPI0032DED9C7